MRLLDTETHKLVEFQDDRVPLYAILSHTWEEDEVSFQDIEGDSWKHKKGHAKILKACERAREDGFDYIWIDTCCIDKKSSAELSEAINSMFRWYQESAVCYAYLADVQYSIKDSIIPDYEFVFSRWFTRGWTLQELIAPSVVIFLDNSWRELGSKEALQRRISYSTNIPSSFLLGDDLEKASVAQRMSWAAKRTTTRVEDLAYCLMGIFNVNMPLLYGEGEMAFIRLQEEILKYSGDHSLFVWSSADDRGGILATSPSAFSKSSQIIPLETSDSSYMTTTVDNKGIHLTAYIRAESANALTAVLPCGKYLGEESFTPVELLVQKIPGNDYYRKIGHRTRRLIPWTEATSGCEQKTICFRRQRLSRQKCSPLLKAVEQGRDKAAELMVQNGAPINFEDKNWQTPLSLAVEDGQENVVRTMLSRREEWSAEDREDIEYRIRHELCFTAVENHDIPMVKLMLQAGATPYIENLQERSLLFVAARSGDEEIVKLLMESYVNADFADDEGQFGPPFLIAVQYGGVGIVKLLLEYATRQNLLTKYGQTALFRAAEYGRVEIIELLLEEHVAYDFRYELGYTPLFIAAKNGHMGVVNLLLGKNAARNTKDDLGYTPLLRALKDNNVKMAGLLLEKHIEEDSADDSQQLLLAAAQIGHIKGVKSLLQKLSSIREIRDKYGRTPLYIAAYKGHVEVVELLLEHHVEKDARSRNGRTPLYMAARFGHLSTVEMLLRAGADPNCRDKYGKSIASAASENGHGDIVKLLWNWS